MDTTAQVRLQQQEACPDRTPWSRFSVATRQCPRRSGGQIVDMVEIVLVMRVVVAYCSLLVILVTTTKTKKPFEIHYSFLI